MNYFNIKGNSNKLEVKVQNTRNDQGNLHMGWLTTLDNTPLVGWCLELDAFYIL
jgi:hypothetical protein